jgi:S1-C subfamily serine protease
MKALGLTGQVPGGTTAMGVVLALAVLLGVLAGRVGLIADGAGGALGWSGAAGASRAALPADEIYRRSVSGVVKIVAFDAPAGGYAAMTGKDGTGFVADADGRIVTCAHVVSPDGSPVSRVRVVFRSGEAGERIADGVVIGVDSASDLAVVRVDPRVAPLTVLPLAGAGELEVGDTVYALGNALDYDFSMTRGIVSALHRVLTGPADATIRDGIQTDAAVNVGDSGGPLLDERGRVVGANERIATPGGAPTGNVGVAFAVPVSTVRDVLRQLEATGRVVRPWVGVEALTISQAAVQLLQPGADRGILLVGVEPDGPAAAAGLRGGDRSVAVPGQPGRVVVAGGDVVTALGGRPVTSTDDLVDCVQALRPGDRLPVGYVRDGKRLTTVVVVGVRPEP